MGIMLSGIAACETIDSSGEILKMDGLDISSLERDGLFNYEHESKTASSIVGKILKAKKIFSEKDCENESQVKFWKQVNTPYLWVMGELFDDVGHSEAMNIAAMLRYDMKAKAEGKYTEGMAQIINLSVEGAKLRKEGNTIVRSIARKISITCTPCNKVASAEIHTQSDQSKSEKKKSGKLPDLSIFKSETLSLPSAEVLESLEKMETPNKIIGKTKSGKDIGSHPESKYALGFTHQDHKDSMNAHYEAAGTAKEPKMKSHHMKMSKIHMQSAIRSEPKKSPAGTTAPHSMKTIHSASPSAPPLPKFAAKKSEMKKALTLGSSAGAPSTLTGGAALSKENLDKKVYKMSKAEDKRAYKGTVIKHKGHEIALKSYGDKEHHAKIISGDYKGYNLGPHESQAKAAESAMKYIDSHSMKKSEAEEYNREIVDKGIEAWDKVQDFRKWLSSRMPSLNKREAEAFTRAFVMFRTKKAEKKLRDI